MNSHNVASVENTSLSGQVVALLAIGAGLCVSTIYYNQPMLGALQRDFHLGVEGVSAIPVATQAGYTVGLVLLSPLGDRFERRSLIVGTVFLLALALAWAGLAPGVWGLTLASLAIGLTATVTQQIIPMAAHIAPSHARGRVLGICMGGVLVGILLGRVVSGVVSDLVNWRTMYLSATAALALLGVALAARLPRVEPVTGAGYPELMYSLVKLARQYGLLRRASLIQACLFAAFSAFWTTLTLFLEAPPYSMGSAAIGAFGFFGVAGALAAPLAGRLADKGGQGRVVLAGAVMVAVSFLVFLGARSSMTLLILGIVFMDLGMQSAMVSNQTRVYALDAGARSRLNTVYMSVMFAGGAVGAAAGAQLFAWAGWGAVCLFGAACGVAAFAVEWAGSRISR